MEDPDTNCTNSTYSTSPGLPYAVIMFDEPMASDNVEVMNVNCFRQGNPSPITASDVLSIDIGTESFTCVAFDTNNNPATCIVYITVEGKLQNTLFYIADLKKRPDDLSHFFSHSLVK